MCSGILVFRKFLLVRKRLRTTVFCIEVMVRLTSWGAESRRVFAPFAIEFLGTVLASLDHRPRRSSILAAVLTGSHHRGGQTGGDQVESTWAVHLRTICPKIKLLRNNNQVIQIAKNQITLQKP